eukprot:m.127417 g.127417  ORF g.127417 m.127417 type:complete len:157 (+) comp13599_c0_seq7:179-649(+)
MRERKRYCHSATASVRCAPRVPSRSVVILIVLLGIFGIEFRTLLSLDHIPLGHLKRFASVHSNTHTSGPIGVMQTATPTIFNFLLLPSHFSSLACSASPLLPISVHSSMSSTIAKQWTEGPHVCLRVGSAIVEREPAGFRTGGDCEQGHSLDSSVE